MNEGLDDEHRSELEACAKELWNRVHKFAMLVTSGDHALAQDATQSAFVGAMQDWLRLAVSANQNVKAGSSGSRPTRPPTSSAGIAQPRCISRLYGSDAGHGSQTRIETRWRRSRLMFFGRRSCACRLRRTVPR